MIRCSTRRKGDRHLAKLIFTFPIFDLITEHTMEGREDGEAYLQIFWGAVGMMTGRRKRRDWERRLRRRHIYIYIGSGAMWASLGCEMTGNTGRIRRTKRRCVLGDLGESLVSSSCCQVILMLTSEEFVGSFYLSRLIGDGLCTSNPLNGTTCTSHFTSHIIRHGLIPLSTTHKLPVVMFFQKTVKAASQTGTKLQHRC